MEFEWNISQDSPHCSSATKSMSSCPKWAIHHNSKDELSSCRCSTTSYGDLRTRKKECDSSAQLVSLYARRLSARQWSFLGPGSEKKWYSTSEDSPQREWDRIAEQMMLTFAESKHSLPIHESIIQRSAQKQRWWKIVDTLLR